jgi:hypothetical protein
MVPRKTVSIVGPFVGGGLVPFVDVVGVAV